MKDQGNREQFPVLQNWREKGSLLPLLGRELFVVCEGDKGAPALLLIHGFPTSSWDWHRVWGDLTKRYRVVAIDLLGFGFSDKPDNNKYTIHLQADLVEAAIQYLDIGEYHVLAHDYGDTVAQELLARQNEGAGAGHWLSGCFLNGGLFPETHKALLTQKLLLGPFGALVNRLSGKSSFDNAFSKVFGPESKPNAEELAQFWHLINYNQGKHLFHNLITYMRDRKLHRKRWVAALQDSHVPLALINGSIDPVSGQHMVARYRALECRLDYLAELPAIGHYPQLEASSDVLRHYLQFLEQVQGS